MQYRPEIDGLRAFAVLPVVAYHAFPSWLKGGFVGVDVFFVISGYLITTIIINDLENKKFNLTNFYERRARRILPALFFMMIVIAPFAWLFMLPNEMKIFSQNAISVSLFISNIIFWRNSGYFEPLSEENPLLHTWSLAIEEQFYLIFPIFMILFWGFGKHKVFILIILTTILSLLVCEWGWRNKEIANFYLLPTRAWELFAGSITAFIVNKFGEKKNNFISLLGLSAILFSIFFYSVNTPFPSLYTCIPVIGSILILIYANKGTIVAKILCYKFFVGIGLISYSIYLWHQPLFAFARLQKLINTSEILYLILSIASIVIAIFSWQFIEKPFRNKSIISQKIIFKLAFIFTFIFIVCGIGFIKFYKPIEQYWLSTQDKQFSDIYLMYQKINSSNTGWGNSNNGEQEINDCVFRKEMQLLENFQSRILSCNKKYGKGILIIGDSHARDLFGSIISNFKDNFIIAATGGDCSPQKNNCNFLFIRKFLSDNPNIFHTIIFEQAGYNLLKKLNGKEVKRTDLLFTNFNDVFENVLADETKIKIIAEYLNELSAFSRVKWFLPRAAHHFHINDVLKRGCEYNFQYRKNQLDTYKKLSKHIDNYIKQNFSNNISTISQIQLYEFNFPKDFLSCEQLYWIDGSHYSAVGEKYFGAKLPKNFILE